MNSPEEIRELSELRLKEAGVLLENNMLDGAFYLAGYSIELSLKAKLCERFDIPNLFSEQNNKENIEETKKENNKMKIEKLQKIKDKIKGMVLIHDLDTLMLLCGLHLKYKDFTMTNKEMLGNMTLIETWNTNIRYKKNGYITKEQVEKLILFLKNKENGLLQWIQNN